jgi:hypothetical protein
MFILILSQEGEKLQAPGGRNERKPKSDAIFVKYVKESEERGPAPFHDLRDILS